MKLLILDIDGTLTRTNRVDTVCFVDAFSSCFGCSAIDTDWSSYRHTTDAGIFRELFIRHFECEPSESDEVWMCSVFVERLGIACRRSISSFSAVPGAATLLKTLVRHPEWHAVLATGGWREAARVKLTSAELSVEFPLASSNDGVSREAIIQAAVAKARRYYGVGTFERAVSVGDGTWDVRTARQLGLPFVGVSAERREELLLSLGVSHVLPDFQDQETVFQAFDAASVPVLPVEQVVS